MTVELLGAAAERLGDIVGEVTFVGGATIALWIDDPGAPPVRVTDDVDVVCDVATYGAYARLGERLYGLGFRVEIGEPVTCRWRHVPTGLVIDVMPVDEAILGFTNQWYAAGIAAAVPRELPGGRVIRTFDPPHVVASKLAAWGGRGRGDLMTSVDAGDVFSLVNGRGALVEEIAGSSPDLVAYTSVEVEALLNHPDVEYALLDAAHAYGREAPVRAAMIRARLERLATLV